MQSSVWFVNVISPVVGSTVHVPVIVESLLIYHLLLSRSTYVLSRVLPVNCNRNCWIIYCHYLDLASLPSLFVRKLYVLMSYYLCIHWCCCIIYCYWIILVHNAIRSTVTLTSFETNPRCIFYSVYLIGVGSPVNPASGVNVISPVVGSTVHVPSFGIVRESLSPSASAITLHLVLWMQSTQPLLDQGHYLDLYHYLTVCKVLLLFLLHWFSSLIYLLLLDYFLVHNQLSGVIYMLKSCQSCCIFYICNQLSDLDHLCNPASGL